MLTDKERELILQELSGESAQAVIAEIIRYDRVNGTPEYHRAMNYLHHKFMEVGFKDVKIHNYPVRPGQRYWAWASEYIWTPQAAELRIIQPENENRALVRFPENAISLSVRSWSTPDAGIKAELVDVGLGNHHSYYKGKNLHGKIALISGGVLGSYLATVRYGALGVITCPREERLLDFPDMTVMDGVPVRPDYPKKFFGFSISKRQFEYLKNLLQSENAAGRKLLLQARVKTQFSKGTIEVLDACLNGSTGSPFHLSRAKSREGRQPGGEVIFVAHLCHRRPSANDNASGCALLVEIARTLLKLVQERKIPPPQHNIRFLILPEWGGSVAWLYTHQKYVKQNVRAVINLDMVGEDQIKCGSVLTLMPPPQSIPSYLPDIAAGELDWAVRHQRTAKLRPLTPFRWQMRGYSGWSDNMPFVYEPLKVPAISITETPDYFYHSSQDTLDKTDPNVLEKTGLAALTTALTITNANLNDVLEIASFMAVASKKRLLNLVEKLIKEPKKEPEGTAVGPDEFCRDKEEASSELSQAYQQLNYFATLEKNRLASLNELVLTGRDKLKTHSLIEKYQRLLNEFVVNAYTEIKMRYDNLSKNKSRSLRTESRRMSGLEQRAKKIIPQKLFTGPFTAHCLTHKLTQRALYDYLNLLEKGASLFEDLIILYTDGERSIYDIYQCASYEREGLDLKSFIDYFHFLSRYGLIKLRAL